MIGLHTQRRQNHKITELVQQAENVNAKQIQDHHFTSASRLLTVFLIHNLYIGATLLAPPIMGFDMLLHKESLGGQCTSYPEFFTKAGSRSGTWVYRVGQYRPTEKDVCSNSCTDGVDDPGRVDWFCRRGVGPEFRDTLSGSTTRPASWSR